MSTNADQQGAAAEHRQKRRLLFTTRAVGGLLANPEGATLGNKKIASMAVDYAERLIEETEKRIGPDLPPYYDLYAGHALRGLLSNPESLERSATWLLGKTISYAEKLSEEERLQGDSSRTILMRRLAGNALGGLIANADSLSYGVSKIISMVMNQVDLVLEKL